MATSSRCHVSPSLPADHFRISFGKVSAKFFSPKSHGLARDDDATSCRHILDHPQAERKPEIEPNGTGNHLRRKSVATIITGKSGHAARSHILIDARLTLRCPSACRKPTRLAWVIQMTLKVKRPSRVSRPLAIRNSTTGERLWEFASPNPPDRLDMPHMTRKSRKADRRPPGAGTLDGSRGGILRRISTR